MPIRNRHFYDLAAAAPYPLDDAATAASDAGVRLPENILVDASLRWPETYGRYAFVAGLTVTPKLVTVVLQAAETADSAFAFAPLAIITVPQPVRPYHAYAVQAQAPGIGGWLVFGPGVTEAVSARFSSPRQSRLTARAARSYRPPPVTSLGAEFISPALTGTITLLGKPPLEVVAEDREINGRLRTCAVVRLVEDATTGFAASGADQAALGVTTPSVFERFSGPCGGRPESKTCGDPQPIEFINAVGPDCDGVLSIVITGCGETTQILSGCGAAVDCNLGLGAACPPGRLPDAGGSLTNPVPMPVVDVLPVPGTIGGGGDTSTDVYTATGTWPYIACFNEDLSEFTTTVGLWGFVDDTTVESCGATGTPVSLSTSTSSSCYGTATATGRNVALWNGNPTAMPADQTVVFRTVTVDLKLDAGPAGARHNGGIVLNYRPDTNNPAVSVYYEALLDVEAQQLQLVRFNGTGYSVVASIDAPGVLVDVWYRLEATVKAGASPGTTDLSARLRAVDPLPAGLDVSTAVTVTNYQPSTGQFGLGSNRAIVHYAYFRVDLAP
jgi:hypothetical protein